MKLFPHSVRTIENALNQSSLKQKIISQNIANVDTPNYKAKDVSFQAALQDAIRPSMHANKTNRRHYDFKQGPILHPGVVTRKNVQYNHNGNSVDLDKEMSDLASNQIYYQALVERLNGKFSTLQSVIKGGK